MSDPDFVEMMCAASLNLENEPLNSLCWGVAFLKKTGWIIVGPDLYAGNSEEQDPGGENKDRSVWVSLNNDTLFASTDGRQSS